MYDRNHRMGMGNGLEGMAPEEALAMGFKMAFDTMKRLGRNGDTELAHVTPQEQQMLQARGGAGTVNPRTGLPEFFGGEGGGGSMGRDDGRVGGGAGGGNRDDGRDQSRDYGFEMERGHATSSVDRSGYGSAGGQGGGGGGSGGTATNPSSAGGSANPSGDTMGGGDSGGTDARSFSERVADGIAAAFSGPSFGPPTGKDPGFLGAAASLAPGIGWGMGLTRGLQAMGIEGEPEYEGRIGDPNREQRDDRMLSPGRPQQQVPGAPPAASYPWTRPGSLPNAPMALGMDAGMTPLQQRAHVATGGTAGNRGIFRDPGTLDFYKQLAFFDLTQPGGAPRPDARLLPVEQQFLTQLGAQPGDTTESFLKALAGLQF